VTRHLTVVAKVAQSQGGGYVVPWKAMHCSGALLLSCLDLVVVGLRSGCHLLFLMRSAIGYIVVGLQRGFALEMAVSPLSPDSGYKCQYVILTY
jgi:hypothetical protein